MTRSHEHQHSAPDFNSPSSRRGKVSLASFLVSCHFGSVLEALVLKELDRHRAMCESSGVLHLLWRHAIVLTDV
jgi:hypothetical protein